MIYKDPLKIRRRFSLYVTGFLIALINFGRFYSVHLVRGTEHVQIIIGTEDSNCGCDHWTCVVFLQTFQQKVEVKLKMSLCLTKRHAVKTYGGMDV
jgi:uncharacterized membrane protein